MAAAADVPDELLAWWKTFNNGSIVDEEEEDSDSEGEEQPDHDRGDEEVGAESASAAREVDQQRTAPALHGDDAEEVAQDGYVQQLQVGTEIQDATGEEIPEDTNVQIGRREPIMTRGKLKATGIEIQLGEDAGEEIHEDISVQLQGELVGRTRDTIMTRGKLRVTGIENHNRKEDKISEDTYVEPATGLLGRKRKETVTPNKLRSTGIEIQDKKGECLRAEHEIMRWHLLCKTKVLEAEKIQRLKLKLNVKNKEIKSLKKQIGELRAENEHYRKKFQDVRSATTEKRASTSSEQDEGDNSN